MAQFFLPAADVIGVIFSSDKYLDYFDQVVSKTDSVSDLPLVRFTMRFRVSSEDHCVFSTSANISDVTR